MSDPLTLEMMNRPILIQDVAGMLRKPVGKNDKPYTADIIKYNNELIDTWYHSVLVKIANNKGEVRTQEAQFGLVVFIEGKELYGLRAHSDSLPALDGAQTRYWIDVLKTQNISQLREMGVSVVHQALQYVGEAIRRSVGDEKWELIYSHSEDPLDWHHRAFKHSKLFSNEFLPYDLTVEEMGDITDKVRTILSNPIEPKKC